MDRHFKIKITDEQTGKSDTLTLDLRRPIEEQLVAFGNSAKSYLHFIANAERDYEPATLHKIVKAVVALFGGSLVWELSSDYPPDEPQHDIQAFLTLNTKRYDTGGGK